MMEIEHTTTMDTYRVKINDKTYVVRKEDAWIHGEQTWHVRTDGGAVVEGVEFNAVVRAVQQHLMRR